MAKALTNSRTLLSPRQVDCLCFAALGATSSEIADILGVSLRTVNRHIATACGSLNVPGRAQAVAKAIALGLILTPPGQVTARDPVEWTATRARPVIPPCDS